MVQKQLKKEAIDELMMILNEVKDVVRLMGEFGIKVTSDSWSATSYTLIKDNILEWEQKDFEDVTNRKIRVGESFYIGGCVCTGTEHKYKNEWIIAPKKLAEIQGEIFQEYLTKIMQSISLKHFNLKIQDKYGLNNNCRWEHWIVINATVKESAIETNKTEELIEEISSEWGEYIYTVFDDEHDSMTSVDNLNGYSEEYACMLEVFSDLVEPCSDNSEFFGVSDEYIDRVIQVRDNMRQLAKEIENKYKDNNVKVTLSKWNQGCEFGMAMYIWIPFQ